MKKAALLLLSLCFLGCNKPNPHPETIDPIYADLQKRMAEAKKNADDEKKNVAEHAKEMKAAKPQTGQIKYAEKRYYQSLSIQEKYDQLVKYYELRIESRLKYARSDYMRAWNKKEAWPNPEEYKEYLATVESQAKKMSWNANDRIKKYLEENPNLVPKAKKAGSSGHDSGGGEHGGGDSHGGH